MTNQDNLPAWAKILLGTPANDGAVPQPNDEEEHSSSSQREAKPSPPAAIDQREIVFHAGKREGKWSWRAGWCAAAREANQ